MGIVDYSKLPLIKSFDKLKYNEQVYSDKHGLGSVMYHYKKDIVIGFSTHRLRFSPDDHDLREIPNNWVVKRSSKVKIEVSGQKVTLASLKRKRKLEKQRAKLLNACR